ncbi:MAG: response regulator, partial [Panacagrimonas sp.]
TDTAGLGDLEGCVVQNKPVHVTALHDNLCRLLKLAPLSLSPPPPPAGAAPTPVLKLLLAEDNLANRKVAQLLLRKLGYMQVDIATNGREAVEAVKASRYDIVLMDVQMPELDGLDAARLIRKELPAQRQPQIVALTANATTEDREACLRAGMDGYLSKPIEPTRLAQALLAAGERLARRGSDIPA